MNIDEYSSSKDLNAALRKKISVGTALDAAQRSLEQSGLVCEKPQPYKPIDVPPGVTMSPEARKIEEENRYVMLCSKALRGGSSRSVVVNVTLDAKLRVTGISSIFQQRHS